MPAARVGVVDFPQLVGPERRIRRPCGCFCVVLTPLSLEALPGGVVHVRDVGHRNYVKRRKGFFVPEDFSKLCALTPKVHVLCVFCSRANARPVCRFR